MRKAPEKNSGQATGVAAAFGTEYAADDGHIVRVHSHLCVEPAQDDEEHIARRNGKAEFRSQEPEVRRQETGAPPKTEKGKGMKAEGNEIKPAPYASAAPVCTDLWGRNGKMTLPVLPSRRPTPRRLGGCLSVD